MGQLNQVQYWSGWTLGLWAILLWSLGKIDIFLKSEGIKSLGIVETGQMSMMEIEGSKDTPEKTTWLDSSKIDSAEKVRYKEDHLKLLHIYSFQNIAFECNNGLIMSIASHSLSNSVTDLTGVSQMFHSNQDFYSKELLLVMVIEMNTSRQREGSITFG